MVQGSQIAEDSSMVQGSQIAEDSSIVHGSQIAEDSSMVHASQFSGTGSSIAKEHTSNTMSINELHCAVDHLYSAITCATAEQTDRPREQQRGGIY